MTRKAPKNSSNNPVKFPGTKPGATSAQLPPMAEASINPPVFLGDAESPRDLRQYLECLGFEKEIFGAFSHSTRTSEANPRARSSVDEAPSPDSHGKYFSVNRDSLPVTELTAQCQSASIPHSSHTMGAKSLSTSQLHAETKTQCAECTACPLHKNRKQSVFGEGSEKARVLFVGEAPSGADEESGKPFAGPAGELLDKILSAMGLSRESAYLTHLVKCRPPNNRNPESFELNQCAHFLGAQIKTLAPRVIVTLGTLASQTLLKTSEPIDRLRGNMTSIEASRFSTAHEIFVMPTFHPAYLMRTPEAKKLAWEDLKKVMTLLK